MNQETEILLEIIKKREEKKKSRFCTVCRKEFPLTRWHFYRQKSSNSGFKYICIPCSKTKDKLIYLKNKEKYIQRAKKWNETHRKVKKIVFSSEIGGIASVVQ